ncbi:MAG: hypothetical protein ACXWP5_03505 [Bdellovibrionota bacterium]
MKSLFLVLVLFFSSAAWACDLCAVFVADQAQGKSVYGIQGGLSEQFTHFGTLSASGTAIPNTTGQYLNSSITQIFATYHFNDQISVQANVSIIARWYSRPAATGMDTGRVWGLGDLPLLARYARYHELSENTALRWNVIGGIKFPTGDSSRIAEELSETDVPDGSEPSGIHGHDLALGSGSFDFMVGGGIEPIYRRFVFPMSAQVAFRTQGSYGYRYANDLTFQFSPGYYAYLQHEKSLLASIVLSGETKGLDSFQGAPADDTGMTALYLGPAITGTLSDNLSAVLAVDLPVLMRNTATQVVPDSRVRVSFVARL